eukprot:354933_1
MSVRSAIHRDIIYVIGGRTCTESNICDDTNQGNIDAIDTTTDSISYFADLMVLASFAAPIVIGNGLFIFGGYIYSPSSAHTVIQYYDLGEHYATTD